MRSIIHMEPRAEWLPAHALAGSIWQGPLGESVRVELDGSLTDLRGGMCGRPAQVQPSHLAWEARG